MLLLDELEDSDLSPIMDALLKVHTFSVDAVDILCRSCSILNQEYVLSLTRAVNSKLRIVNLQDMLLKRDIIWYVLIMTLSLTKLTFLVTHTPVFNHLD